MRRRRLAADSHQPQSDRYAWSSLSALPNGSGVAVTTTRDKSLSQLGRSVQWTQHGNGAATCPSARHANGLFIHISKASKISIRVGPAPSVHQSIK